MAGPQEFYHNFEKSLDQTVNAHQITISELAHVYA